MFGGVEEEVGGETYDESPCVAFAGDVERTGREAWEDFD